MRRFTAGLIAVVAWGLWLSPSTAAAQGKFVIKPLAQRKVSELPAGPLYWRIERFSSGLYGSGVDEHGNSVDDALDHAKAAAGPWSLVAEAAGDVWLFTLGPPGGSTVEGTKVAEVGPISRPAAKEYLLRINDASGPPGSITKAHSHPGSEAFYVLSGETSSITPRGVMRVAAGHASAGNDAGTPMRVSSSGATELHSLVMFVVDADEPFSSPAKLDSTHADAGKELK
ncbi:MAG: hypothetical protein WCA17_11155 [Burkholderiales bacterium]